MSVKSTRLDDENDSIQQPTQQLNHYPNYPDILFTLEPAIQHTTQFLRILLWKKGYTHQSIILTLIWTFFWFHSFIVSYTIPIWISLTLYYILMDPPPISKQTTTMDAYEKLTIELKELQFELQSFIFLPFSSPESTTRDRFRQWYRQSLFVQDQQQHRHLLIFVSFYIAWIGLLQLFSIEKIIWFLGGIVLTWHSSLFKVIRYAYHRAVYLFNKVKSSSSVSIGVDDQTLKTTTNNNKKDYHLDRFYHFVVIEHQRWWLHKGGWASSLLANERPAWSDEYLSKVPSIDQFHLPPPTTRTNQDNNKTVEISWEWTSDNWEIDFNHNVDKNGWEYGSWDWTCWSTKSFGLRVLTRRRHWVRNARLVKKELPVTMPILIKKTSTTSTTANSFSTSASSEDSYMCSTPTTITPVPIMKSSWSASTVSTSIVEPSIFSCSDNEKIVHHYSTSSMDNSQLWLRR